MPDVTDHAIEKALLWMGGLAMALALGVGGWAVWLFATAPPDTSGGRAVVVASRQSFAVTDGVSNAPFPVDLRRFALNALLAPLIDDAEPPRWTDVALDFMCDPATQVLIDGQRMVPGDPVPAGTFSVRWDMNHCEPLGPAMALSGGVELLVTHDRTGMSAVVFPQRLRMQGAAGPAGHQDAFSARLSFAALPGDP